MKVLVVDDEPLIRRSLQRVFQRHEHEVCVAADGKEGVECWKSFSPEIVVIDVLMPEKTGPEVIEEISPGADVGIILISAYTGEYNPESARKLGADHFVAKPFENIVDIVHLAEKLQKEKAN